MIRIKCEGRSVHNAKIMHAETGNEIQGVSRVDITLDGAEMGPPTARLVVYPKDLDVCAELRETLLEVMWAVWRCSQDGGEPMMIGIYESRELAEKHCLSSDYYVDTIKLNEPVSNKKTRQKSIKNT